MGFWYTKSSALATIQLRAARVTGFSTPMNLAAIVFVIMVTLILMVAPITNWRGLLRETCFPQIQNNGSLLYKVTALAPMDSIDSETPGNGCLVDGTIAATSRSNWSSLLSYR